MSFPTRGRLSVLAVGSLLVAGIALPSADAATPSSSATITGHQDWVEQAYENTATGAELTPEQSEVDGPQRAPFGTGSHQVRIGQSTVQTELYRTDVYDNTPLAQLTRLEYSTYARRTSGTGDLRQPTFLRLNVDNDGDGQRDASLFFFPADNAQQQAVANDVWQDWDVTGGRISVDGDTGAAGTTTIADYAAAHQGSTLVNNDGGKADGGALALVTGGNELGNADPQTNGEYDLDRVVVGEAGVDTLYDFGPDSETTGATAHRTVDPTHDQGWLSQAYDDNDYLTSDQRFVAGPGTPPAGGGSLRMSLSNDTNPRRVELFRTAQYDGTLVRDLRTLDFSTFQRPIAGNATPQQPVYLRLNLDDDGDGQRDTSLYFYPGENGTVAQGTWQDWHAADGSWGVDGDPGPGQGVSLADYVVAHPDARIVNNADGSNVGGGVAFLVGGTDSTTQMNGEYFLDDVTIGAVDAATGHTTSSDEFDLEPTAPALSIGDARVAEGNTGATLRFPVTLDAPAGKDVTVGFTTADGTAKAGSDYRATSGTVTIPAGSTTATASVPVVSDKVREADETLSVHLGTPSYGTVADGTARGTIVNDDTRVGLRALATAGRQVRAKVDTLPAAPRAAVTVYRVVGGKAVKVYAGTLNRLGRLDTVLPQHYAAGTRVTLLTKVTTDNGDYRSKKVTVVVA
ncbi:MAG: Calx-beta domain-containing protein [Nocardioides sp.]